MLQVTGQSRSTLCTVLNSDSASAPPALTAVLPGASIDLGNDANVPATGEVRAASQTSWVSAPYIDLRGLYTTTVTSGVVDAQAFLAPGGLDMGRPITVPLVVPGPTFGVGISGSGGAVADGRDGAGWLQVEGSFSFAPLDEGDEEDSV